MPTEQGSNLEQVLNEITEAREDASQSVSVADVLDKVGHRSFGILLLVPALIAFTPLGGIPGLPTAMAIVVILVAGQIVIGKERFWLPQMVLSRSTEPQRVEKAVGYLRPVARVVDKVLRPRMAWLTKPPFVRVAAAISILVALTVPPLELLPFAGTVSWAAIAAFALALIAHDGVLALIALAFSIATGYVAFTTLL